MALTIDSYIFLEPLGMWFRGILGLLFLTSIGLPTFFSTANFSLWQVFIWINNRFLQSVKKKKYNIIVTFWETTRKSKRFTRLWESLPNPPLKAIFIHLEHIWIQLGGYYKLRDRPINNSIQRELQLYFTVREKITMLIISVCLQIANPSRLQGIWCHKTRLCYLAQKRRYILKQTGTNSRCGNYSMRTFFTVPKI